VPSKGAGWGGTAKGASNAGKPEHVQITDDTARRYVELRGTPAAIARTELRRQRAVALEAHLFDLALDGQLEATQVQASTRLHEICEGKPIARQEITGKDGAPLGIDLSRATPEQLAVLQALVDEAD
jgi:hypothetical protein